MKKLNKRGAGKGLLTGVFLLTAFGAWGENTPVASPPTRPPTPAPSWTPAPSKPPAKGELTVMEVSQKVEEAQDAAKDVQMDLDMDMKDSLSGATQKLKGKIEIKSPDWVYVHYTQPTEQFLYVSGSLAQMYQPAQKMVYQQHNGKGQNTEPVYVGVGKELKKYIAISKVTIVKNSGDEVQMKFIPLSPEDSGFDQMKVYIHKKDWWPYQMEMETPSMTTKAVFSHFAFNQGLPDSLFQFTPPKGAQVVEGTVF